MKVLGIVTSPRKEGNTEILVKEALNAAKEEGADTEIVLASQLDINPCIACDVCLSKSACAQKDDMHKIYSGLEKADGVIFGTPVYFLNVSAQAKAIIDRTYAFLFAEKLRGKVAAAVVATRRVGGAQVLGQLFGFFTAHQMNIAGGSIGYGLEKGAVRKSFGGSIFLSAIEEARAVGKQVVRLGNQLSYDRQNYA